MTTATEPQPARPAGPLEGRVATVTGGTCGIGAAISRPPAAGEPSHVTGQIRAVHGGRDT
jgi:NAD(P)-dependent dehydrogenase (short-subunit alcohol dehydrogenase family)